MGHQFQRVNVSPINLKEDILGFHKERELQNAFHQKEIKVSTISSFILEGKLFTDQINLLSEKVLLDPIIAQRYINSYPPIKGDLFVQIRYKKGVSDNLGIAAKKSCLEFLNSQWTKDAHIYTAKIYIIKNVKNIQKEIQFYIQKNWANDNSKYTLFYNSKKFEEKKDFPLSINNNTIPSPTQKTLFEYIDLSKKPLNTLSEEKSLNLNIEEMKAIEAYINQPTVQSIRKEAGLKGMLTDIEIETLAQTWSEHCKHKIFAAQIDYQSEEGNEIIHSLFKSYIQKLTKELGKTRKDLLSVFDDNAGIIQVDEDNAICIKAETHNSPSAIDPFGGAITGVLGVNRDIIGTGLGANPIFNTDVFCFGYPNYNGKLEKNLIHPKHIFKEVHRGVKEAGNESGIPCINGSISFHESFMGKPLVFCGTVGQMPLKIKGRDTYKKYTQKGDHIVVVGGRVGADGIHGATFSSAKMQEDDYPQNIVQIGSPITQKRVLDFTLEARDLSLFNSITDNGAGGLSSSIGEMASQTGGCEVHLDRVPLKEINLLPWQIWISESQERMTYAVPKENLETFLSLAKKRNIIACELGVFNDSSFIDLYYNQKILGKLSMDFLHNGVPQMQLKASWTAPSFQEPDLSLFQEQNPEKLLLDMLHRPNIASKEKWVRQYDHEVKTQSLLKPFEGVSQSGPSNGSVVKLIDSNTNIAISTGINPFYSQIDTYYMGLAAIDEALRNILCSGANPKKLSGLDNFSWPDPVLSDSTPDGPYKLAQLVRANKALYDGCLNYGIPLVSGKDSMKNDYHGKNKKISVLPTLLVTIVGIVEETHHVLTSYLKKEGNLLYLLGETKNEMGAGELYRLFDYVGNHVPKVDLKTNKKTYERFYRANCLGLLQSAHDLSEGGFATAISEMCIGGEKGASIDLLPLEVELDITKLYSESQGRFIIEIEPQHEESFLKIMEDTPCHLLGKVFGKELSIKNKNKEILLTSVEKLKKSWQGGLDF